MVETGKEMETFQIRRATPRDLPEVIMINRLCLPENYGYSFFESILQNYPDTFLVAEVNGRAAGYIMCRLERGLSKYERFSLKKIGHIISIAVLPEYRRRGIATSLLTQVMEILKEVRGCDEVYLETRVSNTSAISLYKRLGFEVVAISKRYYIDSEDAYIMARKL